ncbi:hypothetical protein [Nostoc sp. TCL240-02]|uniref:hypothetical protein n=1 Tax=Nostoc sp. TCL240-02 TaxID=2572090 RepID=UPI00157FBB0D|nr:hypothetical protein [Nostoc sp. TCL240-02]QKQ75675.1 hypothetical protein FBB35_22380 [Nostoc sp. TCL240-02]
MDFSQPIGTNEIPDLITKETRRLRQKYPSIEHLEAGHAASWLQERHDQLMSKAQRSRSEMNLSKLVTLAGTVIGAVCYATSPLASIGAIVSAAGYVWSLGLDINDSHRFAPIPFVRDNLLEFLSAMGDAELREDWLSQRNEIADLMFHLELLERYEFGMLRELHGILSEYLDQVEPGKRFYAYRWLSDRYIDYQGAIPDKDSLNKHLQTVNVDPRINYPVVAAIQDRTTSRTIIPPTARTVSLPAASDQIALPQQPLSNPIAIPQKSTATPKNLTADPQKMLELPIQVRASLLTKGLIQDGFKIDEVLNSQVVAICGTQRGGKGTLAAILATIASAMDSSLIVEYFTAGVDIYPFECNLTSGLQFPGKSADTADLLVAQKLLKFLKDLDNSQPYSHKNLFLVIDEAMRLLSLLEESDRTWAIQYLLSRFAKCGGTLVIVLHGSNLTSVVGKATAGLADTFKMSITFIGCVAVSVPVPGSGLRKMNVASGEYFKASPANFGEPINGGNLGAIPDWLKTEKNPGNGQPDPARTLLKFFPELAQVQDSDALTQNERAELQDAVQNVVNGKFTIFNVDSSEAVRIIKDLEKRGNSQEQIITMLWQAYPQTPEWDKANQEYELLLNNR